MNLIMILLSIASASFLFAVGAEPIQNIKRFFKLDNDAYIKNKYHHFFVKLLNCSLCSGFWIGLILTQNILLACLISVLAGLIEKLFSTF